MINKAGSLNPKSQIFSAAPKAKPRSSEELAQDFKDSFKPKGDDLGRPAFRNLSKIVNKSVDSGLIRTDSRLASTLGKVGLYAGGLAATVGALMVVGPALGVAAATALGASATLGYAAGFGVAALEATQLGVVASAVGAMVGGVTSHIGAGLKSLGGLVESQPKDNHPSVTTPQPAGNGTLAEFSP